jgi:hypothetical protein
MELTNNYNKLCFYSWCFTSFKNYGNILHHGIENNYFYSGPANWRVRDEIPNLGLRVW